MAGCCSCIYGRLWSRYSRHYTLCIWDWSFVRWRHHIASNVSLSLSLALSVSVSVSKTRLHCSTNRFASAVVSCLLRRPTSCLPGCNSSGRGRAYTDFWSRNTAPRFFSDCTEETMLSGNKELMRGNVNLQNKKRILNCYFCQYKGLWTMVLLANETTA